MYGKQLDFFENGGLRDQGETRDPVSGNNVPVGSTQKEVRDDVPAMLSEGEFVLPADVVRYIGLDRLMKMRQDAKQGLENMNRMGQFGNSDQATIPDNLPYNQISPMAQQQPPQMPQQQMAQGGVPQGYHRMPDGRIMANSAHMNRGGVLYAQSGTDVVGQQFQLLDQQGQGNQPDMIYGKGSGGPTFSIDQGASYVEYINPETNERIQIRTIAGAPQEEIPEGFIKFEVFLETLEPEDRAYYEENGELPPDAIENYIDEFDIELEDDDDIEEVKEAIVSSSNDDDPPKIEKSEFQKAGSWQMDTSATDGNALQMWIDEAEKVVNFGGITSGIAGAIGGGLMGAAVHFANKHQKKTILEMIDSKIAQAQKTPIAGQVAALQELKNKLEGKGEKTGLSGVVEGIINTVGDALGLGDKEKDKVKNIAEKENNNAPSKEVTASLTDDDMGLPTEPSYYEKQLRGDYVGSGGYDEVPTDKTTISLTDDDTGLPTEQLEYALDSQTEEALMFGQDPDTVDLKYELLDNNIRTLRDNFVTEKEGNVYSEGPRIGREQVQGVDLSYVNEEDAKARDIGFASMQQLSNMVEDLNINKLAQIVEKLPLTEKTREVKERAEELLVEQGAATPEVERRVQVRNYLKGILKPTKAPTTGTVMNAAGIGTGITTEMANDITNYLAKVAGDPKVRTSATAGLTAAQSAVDDLLTTSTGERVDKATQRDIYYKAVEEQERLARLAAEAAARAKAAKDAAAKKAAEEEAKRLADEAAKKAAEESAALGGKSGKQVLYESLDPDVQTEVAARDEEIVMSQPVVSSNNNDDDGGFSWSDFASTHGFDSGSTSSSTASTEAVKSKTSGLTSTEKKGGAGLDTAMGISGLNKGGLAKPVFKSVRKPDTTRGLAARKK